MPILYEARPTFRDLAGRFTTANKELLEDQRDWVRSEGRRFVTIAQRRAPKGKTGKFAAGIRFRTSVGNNSASLSASVPMPLGKWIIGGTKPHAIVGRPFLAFFWEKLGKKVVFRRVNHPGTKPNPFFQEAYDEWITGAETTFRRISTRWISKVAG